MKRGSFINDKEKSVFVISNDITCEIVSQDGIEDNKKNNIRIIKKTSLLVVHILLQKVKYYKISGQCQKPLAFSMKFLKLIKKIQSLRELVFFKRVSELLVIFNTFIQSIKFKACINLDKIHSSNSIINRCFTHHNASI